MFVKFSFRRARSVPSSFWIAEVADFVGSLNLTGLELTFPLALEDGNVVTLHLSIFQATPVCVLRKFTLDGFCQAVQRHKVTVLYVVPPMVVLLVKNDISNYDLSSVRIGMTGAAPLTEETANGLSRKFPSWQFGQGYGVSRREVGLGGRPTELTSKVSP